MSMPATAARSPLMATGRRRIVDLDVEAARVSFMTGTDLTARRSAGGVTDFFKQFRRDASNAQATRQR